MLYGKNSVTAEQSQTPDRTIGLVFGFHEYTLPVVATLLLFATGCGGGAPVPVDNDRDKGSQASREVSEDNRQPQPPITTDNENEVPEQPGNASALDTAWEEVKQKQEDGSSTQVVTTARLPFREVKEPKHDDGALAKEGIRRLDGKYITVYTDLPSSPGVDELPKVFDAAVPQWVEYFEVDGKDYADWHMTGYIIKDKDLFQRTGLLSRKLPNFENGYQVKREFWLFDQSSDYYRRHLFLHEGTHAFMWSMLGGWCAPWYGEGMAEYFGTHRWTEGKLTMRYFPANRDESPYWGRVKLLRDANVGGEAKSLLEVMNYSETAHLDVEPYAWCWAAAMLLDTHPEYQKAFRELRGRRSANGPGGEPWLYEELEGKWPELSDRWWEFIRHIDYGYDLARADIRFTEAGPLPAEGATVSITANLGWLSTGLLLEKGKKYKIEAAGRYLVAQEPEPWPSEPGGVTIEYYNGRPLGLLLGSVRGESSSGGATSGLSSEEPISLGLGRIISPERSGVLFLKVNDSPSSLSDNSGSLKVRVSPE